MNRDDVRRAVLDLVGEIAPETDLEALRPDRDLRTQVDMDSFDLLRLMVRLKETFGVEVSEADYRKMRTLDDAVAYLVARAPSEGR